MFKNKLYQYFAKEFLKNFLLILISLSLLMLLTQAARFLNIITEMGNSSETYLIYTILTYPKIIEKTIPISFMIGIFFTIAKLNNDKELNIFWYSGVSQRKIFKIIIILTFLIFVIYYFFSIFFSPYASSLSRKILAKSEFTLVNSLVKEKNFNTPLKQLTIFVEENDKNGNLKNIFINESERTVTAKYAKVLKNKNIVYLELYEGISLENNNKNSIKFEKLNFDFSKYQTKNLKVEKFSERNIMWLLKNINKNNEKKKDLIYEINKRLIKPFFLFVIAAISSYILYIKEDKKNNQRYYIYSVSFLLLIFSEILLGYSSKNLTFSIIYFLIILSLSLILSIKHFKKN